MSMTDDELWKMMEDVIQHGSYGVVLESLTTTYQFLGSGPEAPPPNRLALLKFQQSLALRLATLATELYLAKLKEIEHGATDLPQLRRRGPLGQDGGRQDDAAGPGPG